VTNSLIINQLDALFSQNLFWKETLHASETPDDGQRNCLKHVEFPSKINFEKLVHLVGLL